MLREAGYLIGRAASFYGDAIAVTCGSVDRTFREQNGIAESVASALHQQGVRPGDRIGVLGRNSLALLDAWFGCEKLGAVRVVMHPHLSGAVLREQVESLSLRALFVDGSLADHFTSLPAAVRAACLFVVMNGESGGLGPSFDSFVASAGEPCSGITVDDSQPWIIQFTSGTTGRPKPWCKSLRSFIAVIEQNTLVLDRVNRGDAIDHEDVNLHFHALQSSSGFKTLFPYYIRGARTVLMDADGLEDPIGGLCSTVAAQGVSGLLLHGTAFRQWLRHLKAMPPQTRAAVVAHLRRVVTSLVGPRLLDLASDLIGPVWCHTYGSTEQGSPVTALYADDPPAWGGWGTVGRLQSPAHELRIVDPDTAQAAATGQPGEIEVRSEMSLGSYLSADPGVRRVGTDDWLRVGDIGCLDPQGALHFLGRSVDVIGVGAKVLHPWQIEQHLLGLFPVVRCAVVRSSGDQPLIHVLVEFEKDADESCLAEVKDMLAAVVNAGISWRVQVVPAIPTAEGGVKIDRKGAEQLVSQPS